MNCEQVSSEEIQKSVHQAIKDAELSHSKIVKENWNTLQWFESVMEGHAYDRGYVTDIIFRNAILMLFRHTNLNANVEGKQESVDMATLSRRVKPVHIIKESGNIYLIPYKGVLTPTVCVGETFTHTDSDPRDKLLPFFYVFGHIGISYWDDITVESLKNNKLLHRVSKQTFDFGKLKTRFEAPSNLQLFENLEVLGDCTIICDNGKIKSSRLLLSQNSSYFFTYFSKYSNGQNVYPLLDYKVEVVKEYLRFLITKEVELKNISDSVVESLNFASYVQDLAYMNYLYDLVYPELDSEEQSTITKVVKKLLYPKN